MTKEFLWGALAMASWVVGLFFLHFWRTTRDRLFLFLALAFWTLSSSWIGLAASHPSAENIHYQYLIRLVAFGLIIAGIVDKNRRRPGA
jgi:hypothetical protein